MKIIDPHIHLFTLEEGDYQWLKTDAPPYWSDKKTIIKNFKEADLKLPESISLAGFVHIEAGFDNQQPWREIAWLERTCSLPFKSIAGIDLQLPLKEFQAALTKLSQFSSVVGVRDILDENAFAYLSNKQVQQNLAALAKKQLIFECQMPIENIKATTQLIKIITLLPTLSIVINHAGWPPENTSSDSWQEWQQSMKKLSLHSNIYIKCSGFEMVNREYSVIWQQQVIEQCIITFGLNKTMLASNFPLCLFRNSYQKNWQVHLKSKQLSISELEQLCYKNAHRIYQFNLSAPKQVKNSTNI